MFNLLFCCVFLALTSSKIAFGQYGVGNGIVGNGYYQQQQPNYGQSPTVGYAQPSSPDIIDNEVTEAPMIRCTDRGVEFSINTHNPFRGNIYVQGQFGLTECRREFYNNDAPHAAIEVALNECGMIRERRPHGMSYSLVIITNFHPRFVTRVDRAYKILCSYQHTDRPVGVDLEVGSVPTEPLASDAILVPDCEYTMRLGEVNGPPAPGTVKVGDLIYHRWECQNSPVYGMLVKNCKVFDGGNENVTLIDEHGCPTTTGVIQSPPVYSETLNMAYAPIFAFHFPDRTQMNFRCQIQSCNKMDNECAGLTPPNCPQQSYGPNMNVDPRMNGAYGYGPAQPQEAAAAYGPSYSSGIYPASGGSTPLGQRPNYIGAGYGPNWPSNALPLGNVLHGNPSQVLQGIGRPPWPRRRMEKKEGQTMEHKILMATQQLRAHENGSWPPSLIILNRTAQVDSRRNSAASPRRFSRPLPSEEEQRLRQRRAEEKTQDVVASSTVINDGLQGFEWSYENGKEQVRPRSVNNINAGNNPQQRSSKLANSYCLDRSTLVAIVLALGLLSALIFAMFCYLFWDFFLNRHRCGKGLINWRRGGRSNSKSAVRDLIGNLRKSPMKRNYQFPHTTAAAIVPMRMPGEVPMAMSEPIITTTNIPQQNGPQGMLAGILNAGLVAPLATKEQQKQIVPPPVPPKMRTLN